MLGRPPLRRPRAGTAAAAALAVALGLAVLPAEAGILDGMGWRDDQPSHVQEALRQSARLEAAGDRVPAKALRALADIPQAEWMTQGTPRQVRQQVHRSMECARSADLPPVLVAYNLPLRDCSQYSSGNSAGVSEYEAWIDGFAEGLRGDAVVILEPDSLVLIPWRTAANGQLDQCRPPGADRATAADDRFEMLSYAGDALKARPGTRVYLDGTHSGWLAVGDAAERLVQAGVQRADGFALNVSNFETTEKQLRYGRWVSKCIHYGTAVDPDNFAGCGSQYCPATADDISTWGRTDAWYAQHVDNTAGGPAEPGELAHFAINTSRNGQGTWTPERSHLDPETWCNPTGRGLGQKPTNDTGHELADAFLWIKIPGESDGECHRGYGPGTADTAWGVVPPPARAWFPEQALNLIKNADPAFPG